MVFICQFGRKAALKFDRVCEHQLFNPELDKTRQKFQQRQMFTRLTSNENLRRLFHQGTDVSLFVWKLVLTNTRQP
jgi:hypothetical protein